MLKLLTQHNRKWLGWVLSLTLIVMASTANASWQCPDGTQCRDHTSCLHKSETPVSHQVPNRAHCSHCLPAVGISPSKGKCLACPRSQCVLHIANAPNVKQVERFQFAAPDIILAPSFAFDKPFITEIALCAVKQTEFFPRHFLRPYLGRAPPA